MEVPSLAMKDCVSGRFQHTKVMKFLSDLFAPWKFHPCVQLAWHHFCFDFQSICIATLQ